MRKSQYGFGAIELILIIVAVGVLAFIGWHLYQSRGEPIADQEVPAITDTQDLNQAETFLNGSDLDGQLDTSDIDSALSY